jgi:hypothetical protein
VNDEFTPQGTGPGENRWRATVYLRRTDEGLLVPLPGGRRRRATHRVHLLLEYPSYHEERSLKLAHTHWHPKEGVFRVDWDGIEEARVRRCLVEWDVPRLLPSYHPLDRIQNQLVDRSLGEWHRLPPLLRKAIAALIHEALGPV